MYISTSFKINSIKSTILEHQNNKQKLQILEELHIRNIQPKLNRIVMNPFICQIAVSMTFFTDYWARNLFFYRSVGVFLLRVLCRSLISRSILYMWILYAYTTSGQLPSPHLSSFRSSLRLFSGRSSFRPHVSLMSLSCCHLYSYSLMRKGNTIITLCAPSTFLFLTNF